MYLSPHFLYQQNSMKRKKTFWLQGNIQKKFTFLVASSFVDPDPDLVSSDPDLYRSINIVRHVTGWDKDYLRKIPRVVW
jgi:hypothetical protein